jgi:hypothetical protein
MFFLQFLLDDRKIQIQNHISDQCIRMRIREAQKHMDPTDPDYIYTIPSVPGIKGQLRCQGTRVWPGVRVR